MTSWERARQVNLLAPEILNRIHTALRSGPIVGYWYRAHSGGGPNYLLAEDAAQFQTILDQARAGDHYELWSIPDLVASGVALAGARYDSATAPSTSLFTTAETQAIADYLSDPEAAVLAVFFGTARGAEVWVDGGNDWEYIRENAEWYNLPGGQGYVFPLATIETARYALVEAVYPPAPTAPQK